MGKEFELRNGSARWVGHPSIIDYFRVFSRSELRNCAAQSQMDCITQLRVASQHATHSGVLLRVTFKTEDLPGGRTIRFRATLPDSTQTMWRYSSFPKSGICWAFTDHGFHTTVEAEPVF